MAREPSVDELLQNPDDPEFSNTLRRYIEAHPHDGQSVEAAIASARERGTLPAPLATEAQEILAASVTRLRTNEAATRLRADAEGATHAAPHGATLLRPGTDVGTRYRTESAAQPATSGLAPGSVIKNRFVLQEQIGRGGMGVVFAAIDRRKEEARDPNPRIAIKILNDDFRRHPDALVALQREARKAQELAHPNVVTVFDFDRDGDLIYMTMELLQGRSLDAVTREVRGSGMARAAALPIVRGIAEGLAYAHRKGFVHSDLKPGNVFLLDDGTPKLLDFGIARAVSSKRSADHFDAGTLGAYTEAYATEEMVTGADPDPADDVYALGLIAYELLMGRHPYQRLSAEKARARGLQPPMPRSLKRAECRSLDAAIALDRSKRPKDAADFLRRFFGAGRLHRHIAIAAVAIALVSAGVFSYRDYVQSGPAIAFEQLPVATQSQFSDAMVEGNASWQFYERDGNVMALYDAVDRYAEAYRLHPKNRDASKALARSADAFMKATAAQPAEQQEAARMLSQKSDYLARYLADYTKVQ